jgi:hypothetical protein
MMRRSPTTSKGRISKHDRYCDEMGLRLVLARSVLGWKVRGAAQRDVLSGSRDDRGACERFLAGASVQPPC